MSKPENQHNEPDVVPVDVEAQQRELKRAGWERVERMGKTVWRNPLSGHLYPQGPAIVVARRQRARVEEATERPRRGRDTEGAG